MTATSPSKNIKINDNFVNTLLPGVGQNAKPGRRDAIWFKYLRLSIAIIRLAEYDYLSKNKHWKTAKIFLFGNNTLFSKICVLMKINIKMARIKLIAYRKERIVGDPIFNPITDQYTSLDGLNLNPTSSDINNIINKKKEKNDGN